MTMKTILTLFTTLLPAPLAVVAIAQDPTVGAEFIGIDQVGYLTEEPKDFRVISTNRDFQIIRSDGQVVLQGALQGPVADPFAGAEVWIGRFTELRAPGRYTVRLADGTASWPFAIGGEVYRDAIRAAIQGLYSGRCGYAVRTPAVAHPVCHQGDGKFVLLDGKQIPDPRDVSGAWHNGGDYRRSTMSAAQAVSRILWPLELYPTAYAPVPGFLAEDERWGARPDALAEAKWGLDWLMKMQFPDGGISIGLGPETNIMPPQIPPQEDKLHNFIGAAYSAHTAKVGAVLAKAARLLKTHDEAYAQRCLKQSLACWRYLEDHPTVVAPKTCATYGNRVDAPDRLWIAVELFRATGESQYHEYFKKAFAKLDSAYPPAPISTQTIRVYNLHEALISYCFAGAKADQEIRQKILSGLKADCDRMVRSADASGYGNVLENWKQRHTSGNTMQMAWELAMASELLRLADYRRVALDQLHFVLGRNPLGKVFATGLGSNPVRDPHYRPCVQAKNDPPPGLLVKGPTLDPEFLKKTILPRFKVPLPPMKSYVDGWANHWCNEPDIEVQGHLIGLLAWAEASHKKLQAHKTQLALSARLSGAHLDEFGGATTLSTGKVTGAFRVAEVNGRLLFITPAGHGFFSLGVTHVRHYLDSEARQRLVASKYGSEDGLSQQVVKNLRAWGYNSAGYGVLPPMEKLIPYVAVLPTAGPVSYSEKNAKHRDIFDPKWQVGARQRIAQQCARQKDTPNLIGYYYKDLPAWNLEAVRDLPEGNWVTFFRNLPADAPGKQRYLSFLRDRAGGDLAKFTKLYRVDADSWDAASKADFSKVDATNPAVRAEDEIFLGIVAEQYYRFYHDAVRAVDSRHLILGDRYPGWKVLDSILLIARKHVDVVSIQPIRETTFNTAKFDQAHALTGLPILLCDQRTRSVPFQEHNPEEERKSGEAYRAFLEAATAKPYIVGKHRCTYIDDIPTRSYRRPGLLRDDESPYATLIELTAAANRDALATLYGTAKATQSKTKATRQ